MKRVAHIFVTITLAVGLTAYAETGDLSQDEMDACGAILCLAGGAGYSECRPYFDRYYSIDKFKNRVDFLKKCPISDTSHTPQGAHEAEIEIIARYGGFCEPSKLANYLNSQIEACERTSLVTGEHCTPSGDEWKICAAFYSSRYVGYKPPKLIKECASDSYLGGAQRCNYRWVISQDGNLAASEAS